MDITEAYLFVLLHKKITDTLSFYGLHINISISGTLDLSDESSRQGLQTSHSSLLCQPWGRIGNCCLLKGHSTSSPFLCILCVP